MYHYRSDRCSWYLGCIITITYSCYSNSPNMVPAKGGFINLREGQPASLISVGDVGKIIVEVVKGKIAARSHVLLESCDVGVYARLSCRGCSHPGDREANSKGQATGEICALGRYKERKRPCVLMSDQHKCQIFG